MSIEDELIVGELTSADLAAAQSQVVDALIEQWPRDIERSGDAISFRAGFLRAGLQQLPGVWSGSLLNFIDQGRIAFRPGTPGGVGYALSTRHMALAYSVPPLFVGVFLAAQGRPLLGLIVSALFWFVAVGGTYWWTAGRFKSLLRESMEVRGSGPLACPACGAGYDPRDYRPDAPRWECGECGGVLPHHWREMHATLPPPT